MGALSDARRPRIAFVIDTLERGGAERVLVALARALAEGDGCPRFDVHVVTTRGAGPLAAALGSDVRLHALARRSRADVAALPRLARLLAREAIDVVCAHSHTAAFFALASRPFGGRWSLVMHDHHPPIAGAPLLRALDRRLLRGAAHYFAASEPLAEFARRCIGLPAGRVEWLPNAVPIAADATAWRPPRARLTIAHVARFFPEKNQRLALDVATRLRDAGLDVRWTFVGRDETPYGRECRAEATRRALDDVVTFDGERDAVGDVLRDADVGVLTSDAEALPVALLEYMAAGLPVVVTDVGSCRAVVPADGGAVVAPGDAEAHAAALLALARDAARRQAAGAANLRAVGERHGVAAMAARVAEVLARVTST